MANEEHLARLKQGVAAWNQWRDEHPEICPDLRLAYLYKATLVRIDFRGANLEDAELSEANLTDANLTDANLTNANLTNANLTDASLFGANLTKHHHRVHQR